MAGLFPQGGDAVKLTDKTSFSCGCITGIGPGQEFVIQPCSLSCRIYQYAMSQLQDQAKSVTYVRGHVDKEGK